MFKTMCVLSCLLVVQSHAAIHFVSLGNSIQSTVELTSELDTVIIEDGVYNETVILYGRTLTIGSRYLLEGDTSHIVNTVVQGTEEIPDTASCFVYAYGEGAGGRLVGLTLSGGMGTRWDRPEEAAPAGGALFVNVAHLSVENCIIENSSADYGGGILVAGQRYQRDARVDLHDCRVRDCSANFWGGGCHASQGSLAVNSCSFDRNISLFGGGGLYVANCEISIDSTSFTFNSGRHAGISCGNNVGTITNCLFEHNSAPFDDYGHGAIGNSEVVVSRCIFRNSIGSMVLYLQDQLGDISHFIGNIVENHSSSDELNGTIVISNGRGEFAYNIIRNNYSPMGGSIVVASTGGHSQTRIHHNVFEDNRTSSTVDGSVLVNLPGANPSLDSNWFVNNDSPVLSHQHPIDDSLDARNNWWGHESGPYHAILNPQGQGDTLLQDDILFDPWLLVPPDTTMPSAITPGERPEILSTWRIVGLYPNPFNSEFRIVLAGFTGNDFQITLHDILGREAAIIHEGSMTGGQLNFRAPSSLSSGVYFVRAQGREQVDTRKVILLK